MANKVNEYRLGELFFGPGGIAWGALQARSGKENSHVVLTMYKMNGNSEKGWAGRQVWVPNIKLPDDVVYYDVHDMPDEEQEFSDNEEHAAYGPHKVNAYRIDRRKSAENPPKY